MEGINSGVAISRGRVSPAIAQAPYVDLKRFRCRATVDVLVLEVSFSAATTFQKVQRLAQRALDLPAPPSVTPANGATTPPLPDSRFFIRLHDLRNLDPVKRLVKVLSLEFRFASAPRIRELEVAVDFFSKAHDRDELEQLRIRLNQTLQAVGDKVLRYSEVRDGYVQFDRIPRQGAVLIGNEDALWRVYLKDTDSGRTLRSREDHRVRVEINLKGNALPEGCSDLTSIADFRFQSLTPSFKFRLPQPVPAATEPSEIIRQVAIRELIRRAGTVALKPRVGSRRKFSEQTTADRQLHDRIRDALRNLTRRWQGRH